MYISLNNGNPRFTIIHLTPLFMSEFCYALSLIIMHTNVLTVSACKTNEKLQATSPGLFLSKGNGLHVRLESCFERSGQKLCCFSDALTATSRLHSSIVWLQIACNMLGKSSYAAIKHDTSSLKHKIY